jgi:hypothetical protein
MNRYHYIPAQSHASKVVHVAERDHANLVNGMKRKVSVST